MKIIYTTGTNNVLFLNSCLLWHSFQKLHPNDSLYICDFGLNQPQINFLKSLGVYRPSVESLSRNQHPWYLKPRINQYFKDMPHDGIVWLDCDMLILHPIIERINSIATQMQSANQILAMCPDVDCPTIESFIQFCNSMPGLWIDPFIESITQQTISPQKPYYNIGFLLCLSEDFWHKWNNLSKQCDINEACFEQNIFNIMVHQDKTINIHALDSFEFNNHGKNLMHVDLSSTTPPPRILHAASHGEFHKVENLQVNDQDKTFHATIKFFNRRILRAEQNKHLQSFLKTYKQAFEETGVLAQNKQ